MMHGQQNIKFEVQLSRMGEKVNAHRYVVGKPEGKTLLGVTG
jgi:hypothetical protein